MIRKLMASSALLALVSAGALTVAQAEDNSATKPLVVEEQATTNQPAQTEAATADEKLTPDRPTLASVYIGRAVYSSAKPNSDKIGSVSDLIVGEDGTISDAVVGVGGFLGIGEKDVAVPFKDLQVVEKDGDIRLIYAATREQLEAAPELDRTAYDPIARYQEQQATALNNQAQGLAPPLAPASGDLTAAPASGDQTAATETAPSQDQATAPAENQMAASEQPSAKDETAAPASDQTAAAPPASSGNVVFMTTSADQVRANDLIGHEVNGPEAESIGTISDLVFQREGATHAALIDVGGFLGVGQKTVAIRFSDLQFSRDDAGNLKVAVAMTKDQLEKLPEVETGTAVTEPAVGGATSNDVAATNEQSPLPAVQNEQSADPTAATEQAPAEGQQPADQTAAGTEAPAAQTQEPALASGQAPMDQDAIATASIGTSQEIAASNLIGAAVYGPDDSSLGKIGDVVFDQGGDINGVVINVGGFLGIGAKPVAIDFESLQIRTDANNTVTVMVDATKDQLNQAPTYEVSMK